MCHSINVLRNSFSFGKLEKFHTQHIPKDQIGIGLVYVFFWPHSLKEYVFMYKVIQLNAISC